MVRYFKTFLPKKNYFNKMAIQTNIFLNYMYFKSKNV